MLGTATFVLPLSGGDVTLNKINQDNYSSEYLFRNTTLQYRLRIRHTETSAGKERHNLEAVKTTFGVDGAPDVESKFYFVIEHELGDDPTEVVDAVADKVILTTNELIGDLLGKMS